MLCVARSCTACCPVSSLPLSTVSGRAVCSWGQTTPSAPGTWQSCCRCYRYRHLFCRRCFPVSTGYVGVLLLSSLLSLSSVVYVVLPSLLPRQHRVGWSVVVVVVVGVVVSSLCCFAVVTTPSAPGRLECCCCRRCYRYLVYVVLPPLLPRQHRVGWSVVVVVVVIVVVVVVVSSLCCLPPLLLYF